MDAKFDGWVRARFASPLRAIAAGDSGKAVSGDFVTAMRSGAAFLQRKQADSARVALERAQALFPDYAGPSSPAEYLAGLANDRGDYGSARAGHAHHDAQRDGVGRQHAGGGAARAARRLGRRARAARAAAVDLAVRRRTCT